MAPSNSIPPPLAPSVEEAYRRKCIQLKQRTAEVEEANDAARLRLARLKRQVEKQRIERAFLLEQLSKRTSTNVEDSEGSPSPPPTPKEKPLRTKRGHRKASLMADIQTNAAPGTTFISQHPQALSPSSDAFSHGVGDSQSQVQGQGQKEPRTNGAAKTSKKPSNAFDLYCADQRPILKEKIKDESAKDDSAKDDAAKDDAVNVDEELARGWAELPDKEREEYKTRYEEELAKYKKAKEQSAEAAEPPAGTSQQADDTPAPDEDVEMPNYDTEAEPTPGGEKQEE